MAAAKRPMKAAAIAQRLLPLLRAPKKKAKKRNKYEAAAVQGNFYG